MWFLQTTISCVGGESARSFTDYYVDILFALNKKYFDNLRHWLTEMVNTDNFPTANVTKEQKQHFATFVLKERSNKRKLLEVTREFSLACCGLVSQGGLLSFHLLLTSIYGITQCKFSSNSGSIFHPTQSEKGLTQIFGSLVSASIVTFYNIFYSPSSLSQVGTEYAMQMGQVMAVWDRIGMKEEDKKLAKDGGEAAQVC